MQLLFRSYFWHKTDQQSSHFLDTRMEPLYGTGNQYAKLINATYLSAASGLEVGRIHTRNFAVGKRSFGMRLIYRKEDVKDKMKIPKGYHRHNHVGRKSDLHLRTASSCTNSRDHETITRATNTCRREACEAGWLAPLQ